MLTTKPGQVLGDDTIYFAAVHIVHHALKIRTIKIGAAPAIVYILVIDGKTLLLHKLIDNGALGLNAHAVTVVFIVPAQTHI